MDFLFDNPLANLPGPEFLVLYVVFTVLTVVGFQVLKNRLDETAQLAAPPIPHNPDPFEIAYLRGGANELARAVVFALVQRNLLRIENEAKISRLCPTGNSFERRSLQPVELIALEWFGASNREPKELFNTGGLSERLKPFSQTFQARLEAQNLTPDDQMKSRHRRLTIQAFLVFAGLGAYKFFAALYNGYSNVFFLVLVLVLGTIALGITAKMPRLTKLGKIYLERLQLAFGRIKPANHYADFAPAPAVPSATFGAVDPFLLSVGVFGGAALAGTIYSDYNRTFERANNQSSSSGGCGSASCGSSSCSSGGDGGGGGGCGGGCGGCS